MVVAPHAGAWIETFCYSFSIVTKIVAPHAGAWIETSTLGIVKPSKLVAPHAGAWIETYDSSVYWNMNRSRLTQARGLKLLYVIWTSTLDLSRLTQARGLKQFGKAQREPLIRRASRRRVD